MSIRSEDWYPTTRQERREQRRQNLPRGRKTMIVQGRGYIQAFRDQKQKERRAA